MLELSENPFWTVFTASLRSSRAHDPIRVRITDLVKSHLILWETETEEGDCPQSH